METNNSKVIQGRDIFEIKNEIDLFIKQNPNYIVFSTQIFYNPKQKPQEDAEGLWYIGGYDCIIWYRESPQEIQGLSSYDLAKSKKIENKNNNPATSKQIWALEQCSYNWVIPKDKITFLQAKSILQDFGYKGAKHG